jgi:hypothetical protein
MARSDINKLAVTLVCLAAAVIFFLILGRDDVPADARNPGPVDLVCLECGHHFQLSHEEFEKGKDLVLPGTAAEVEGHAVRGAVAADLRFGSLHKCPACGEIGAVEARLCPVHDIYYPLRNYDGTPGECPLCKEP